VKFKSALITQASGSVGGATFARNQGGLYIRARSVPVNPATPQQVAVRNFLATLTNRWTATLTVPQRSAWAVYAANVPLTGPLGDTRPVSALSMFIRTNVPRLQAGASVVDAGPTVYTLGTLTAPTLSASAATQLVSVAFTNTDLWAATAAGRLLIYVSKPQSVGVNFFKGPYRFTGAVSGNATPPTSPVTMAAPFAFVAGQRLFYYATAALGDGRLTAQVRGSFSGAA